MDEAGDPEGNQSRSHSKLSSSSHKLLKIGEDSDEEIGEKPLKKARFIWEIKGNYHLKNTSSEPEMKDDPECSGSEASTAASSTASCITDPSSVSKSQKETGHPLPMCNHDLPTTSSDTTRTRIINSLPPLRIDASSVSCVVCDTFNENIKKACLNTDGEQPSETVPLPSHPDCNVRKWQTRQIAKAFMDNTINSVLDELGFTPLPESAPDTDPADDFASIYFPGAAINGGDREDEENDEGIENEGILSAIQKHGLQRHSLEARHHSFSRHSPISCPPSPRQTWASNDQIVNSPADQGKDAIPSTPESLSVGSDIETRGPILSPVDIETDESDSSSSSDVDSSNDKYVAPSACRCAYLSPSKNSEDACTALLSPNVPPSAYSTSSSSSSDDEVESKLEKYDRDFESASSNSSTKICSKSVDQEDESCKKRHGKTTTISAISKRRCVELMDDGSKSSSTSFSQMRVSPVLDNGFMPMTSNNSDINSPTFGHFEFMDAAVATAIQIKGLSALACQDI